MGDCDEDRYEVTMAHSIHCVLEDGEDAQRFYLLLYERNFQGLVWLAMLRELVFLFAFHFPELSAQVGVSVHGLPTDVPPGLVGGLLLCCVGASLRIWSAQTLDILYNSSLSLRPAHRLVMTGPYSYVRHPGYAGAVLSILGVALCYSQASSSLGYPLLWVEKWLAYLWTFCSLSWVVGLVCGLGKRIPLYKLALALSGNIGPGKYLNGSFQGFFEPKCLKLGVHHYCPIHYKMLEIVIAHNLKRF